MPKSTLKDKVVNSKKNDIVWDTLTISDWLRICQTGQPHGRWEASGNTIRGLCPYHKDEQDPSFFINLDRKAAKCFGAGCNVYIKDAVGLYGKLTNQSIVDAALDLSTVYGLKLANREDQKEYQEFLEVNRICELFSETCHLLLLDTYNNQDSPEYKDYLPALKYLTKIRKIEIIPNVLPIGVVPSERILEKYVSNEKDRLEISKLMDSIKDIENIGQLIFTYRYAIDRIAYFKIRKVKDVLGNLTEGADRQKNMIVLQHPALKGYTEDPAIFGLEAYRDILGRTDSVYVVEGEFDLASIVTNQISQGIEGDVFVAIGGSNGYDLTSLQKNFGFSYVHLLLDSPPKKGDLLAYRIVRNNNGSIKPYVYNWDIPFLGDDPDDVVHKNEDFVSIYKHFTDTANYLNEEDFVTLMIEKIIKDEEKKGRKIPNSDKVRYVAGEVQNIKDVILCSTVIPKVCEKMGLDKDDVTSLIRPKEEDESTFYKKFNILFNKTYTVLGTITNGGNNESDLFIWDKVKKESIRINGARLKESSTMLAKEVGSLYSWTKGSIGIPYNMCYVESKNGEIERSRFDIETKLERNLYMLIKDNMKNKIEIRVDEGKRNGVYWLKRPDSEIKDWYFLNGHHLFYGVLNEETTSILWKRIDVPIYNNYYFALDLKSKEMWSEGATTEKYMNSETLSLREIWEKLDVIMHSCLNFKYSVDYVTAMAMCLYIPTFAMFEKNLFLRVSGETSSGKSRYSFGIIGGKSDKSLQLIDHVINIESFSEAAWRQKVQGHNLTCALDEFEDSGTNDDKSRAVRKILENVRTADTGTKVIRGTPGGEVKEFEINSPLIVAGVRPFTSPMDINRFINITTEKKDGFRDSGITMSKLLTKGEQAYLRKSLTVGLYKYTHKVLNYLEQIKQITSEGSNSYMGISYRTMSQLNPIAAWIATVYDSLDKGIEYINHYIDDRGQEMKLISAVGHTSMLWTELMRAQAFKLSRSAGDDRIQRDYNLVGILQSGNLREQLLDTPINGIKIYERDMSPDSPIKERKYYLIISWEEAKYIFRHGSEFRTYPVSKLKEVADRDSKVINSEEAKKIMNWRHVLRENINLHEISILDVTDIVSEGNSGFGEECLIPKEIEIASNVNTSSNYE